MTETRGVVAAGSEQTAQAGVEILRSGGNAVDALVAASLATAAGEPPLTSLAGGGVMLHYNSSDQAITICDFSPDAPGIEGPLEGKIEFFPVELHFGPTTQSFHIGRGAAAVPGVLPGLMAALDRWGRLPLTEVIQPACRLLREGRELDRFMAECLKLLRPILLHTEGMRSLFAADGQLLRVGDRCPNPALADTLERLAEQGWPEFLQREWIPAVLEDFGVEAGGCITRADLEGYQVEFRTPLERDYRGHQVYLPPLPAAGGTLIGLSLALLETTDLGAMKWGSARHLRTKIAAMRVIQQARAIHGDPLAPPNLTDLRSRFAELLEPGGVEPTPPGSIEEGSTTNISVIDAEGNAAAATISHGEGNGYVVGKTGIPMNNMMGEADLHPGGFHTIAPGARLATMMSPTLIRCPDGATCMLGTGGANRIRSAITQVISNLSDFHMSPQKAVDVSRLHWEQGNLHIETFDLNDREKILQGLQVSGEELVRFEEPHMFFGGVHMARRSADGALSGGGDLRRTGVVLQA